MMIYAMQGFSVDAAGNAEGYACRGKGGCEKQVAAGGKRAMIH